MDELQLSDDAIFVLRFRVRGYRLPFTEARRPAFEELAAAGLLESNGEDYRLVDREIADETLREQEDRIARNRHEPPDDDLTLSEEAASLLSRIANQERVEVTDANRSIFRELQAARVVMLGSSFAGGSESVYRFTYWGWHRRHGLAARAPARSPSKPASPRQ